MGRKGLGRERERRIKGRGEKGRDRNGI